MPKRKIGALLSKKTTDGKEYYSGVITDLRGDIQIVVFRNDKKTDNQAVGQVWESRNGSIGSVVDEKRMMGAYVCLCW
jgi:hypothetical protein